MRYEIETVCRIQEGASMEDIENGDAYETAYVVYDETGDIVMDTTSYERAKRYIEDEDEYVPSAYSGDYSSSCPWNAPGMSAKDFI